MNGCHILEDGKACGKLPSFKTAGLGLPVCAGHAGLVSVTGGTLEKHIPHAGDCSLWDGGACGETFECRVCGRTCGICFSASDDPDLCDDCFAEKKG